MASSAKQISEYTGPLIFSFGFRPFFLAGALTAFLVPVVTALSFSGIWHPNFAGNILAWHGHEMVYGYLSAVVAGFILTAVPNWTGGPPILGARLMALTALWVIGRISMLIGGEWSGIITAIVDSSFLFILSAILWREIIAGKNWRNAPVCVLILSLAVANAIWHYDILQGAGGQFGLKLGLSIIAILIGLIGGRIIPSFTRNWLAKNQIGVSVAQFSRFDKVALVALALGLLLWLISPMTMITGLVLLAAGTVNLLRLLRWNGRFSLGEPLILILHIGYFWFALSIVLMGISNLAPSLVTESSALHALTAGAMGVMTLAVMTRATRGHTGRPLSADTVTTLIFALINLGAILRVCAPALPDHFGTMIFLSSLFWSGGFLLFLLVYGQYLFSEKLPTP